MCGRATLSKKPKEIEKRYQATFEFDLEVVNGVLPSYNIAPTHWHPVITNDQPQQLQLFKWGLIPSWAKDSSIASRLINARIETIAEKPAFKAIHSRRCLIPFDGFYEWKTVGKQKTPYHIVVKDQAIFSAAGIWETYLMSTIHNRMPAILTQEQEAIWLDTEIPTKEVLSIITPYPSELMDAYQVSPRVGKVSNNDARLIARDFPRQGTLF